MTALFDPFGANHDATGVTTGLFLTRALVVAHGGHLGAEGEERSTVLFARLPRQNEVDPEPTGPEATENEGEHT
jgi:nitrogen-specific signal transduction histidine kinase